MSRPRLKSCSLISSSKRAAYGGDRCALIDALAACGQFAVIRREDALAGYAAARPFVRCCSLYNRLTFLDKDGVARMELAESFDSKDAKTWTVKAPNSSSVTSSHARKKPLTILPAAASTPRASPARWA